MTTAPDPLAALGFAAAHGLDRSQSSDEYMVDMRSGETDDLVVPLTPEAERRARWQAYAHMTTTGLASDDLLAETRDPDARAALWPAETPSITGENKSS